MSAKTLRGVEHFCDNPKCGMHPTMFPVRPHNPMLDHTPQKIGTKGVRYTFMRAYEGLEVEIHLCESCYSALDYTNHAQNSDYVLGLKNGMKSEPACYNPKCKHHEKLCCAVTKNLFIPKIGKISFPAGVMGPDYNTTVKYETEEVTRTRWHYEGGKLASVLCDACTHAEKVFGEGDYT